MSDSDFIIRFTYDEFFDADESASEQAPLHALAARIRAAKPLDRRADLVLRLTRAVEQLRAAEGALVELLAEAAAFADDEAAVYAGSNVHGDAYSGALRALAAEVAIPTAQNGRTLHRRMAEAGEYARVLPALTEVVRTGALSLEHLRAAERAAVGLTRETVETAETAGPLRDEFERRLLDESVTFAVSSTGERHPMGTALTPRQFGRLAARIVAEVSPVSVAEDLDRAMAERCVQVQSVAPGMSALTMVGPTVLVEAVFDRLRSAARALDARDEPRTRAQREVDTAFALLIAGELDAAGGAGVAGVGGADLVAVLKRIRPVVHVTVPALSLLGHEGAGPAMLDDEHPVPVDVAAVLCGQASQWTRVLTDPVRGVPVAADTYAPGRELRRVLQARDRHCRAPGCAVPARRCDIDHTVEWRRGGRTVPEKLSCLCRYHHVMREFGWGLAQPVPGVLEWTSPGGRVYRTSPSRIAPLGPPVIEPPGEPPPAERRPPGDTCGEPASERPPGEACDGRADSLPTSGPSSAASDGRADATTSEGPTSAAPPSQEPPDAPPPDLPAPF